MYTALYRSFRPETFDRLLGQEHIVKILKNQIQTGTTGHAYLFCGTRGTGKTTTARILAKGMNCIGREESRPCGTCAHCIGIKEGTFIDVVEIDAASNNGVDNIRELRESVKYPPAVGRCKVYIIDEVHMLSTGAFNALLKTLEEPPDNVMFILATTEVQKLPATILSRCLRLDFKRVAETVLRQGMRDICLEIDVKISDAALGLIASNADGSVRDGLSLLDQCISSGEKTVSRETVIEILGTAGEETLIEMTELIFERKTSEALILLNQIVSDGKDIRQFMKDWISHFRNLLMTKYIQNPEDILNMSAENVGRIRTQSGLVDLEFIDDCIMKLSQTLSDAKWSTQPRVLLELTMIRLTNPLQVGGTVLIQSKKAVGIQTAVFQNDSHRSKEKEVFDPCTTPKERNMESVIQNKSREENLQQKSGLLDYDIVWHAVFEEGEAQRGSFNLLRLGTKLTSVGENQFYVEAASEMILDYVKENASVLEMLMEKHVGRKLRLDCGMESQRPADSNKSAEELANEIGNKFGLQIDIQ